MSDYNVHSTLFFKYLRASRHLLLLFFMIMMLHFLLLYLLPGNRGIVSDLVWITAEILKISLIIMAVKKTRNKIGLGWIFILVYALLVFSVILIRAYCDIFLHNYQNLSVTPYIFSFANIYVIVAFIQFSQYREDALTINRQLNLHGIVLVTIIIISYVISYSLLPHPVKFSSLAVQTVFLVANISAFIIGLVIYWISISKKNYKRRVIFIILLSSVFFEFIIGTLSFSKKIITGGSFTGGYGDLFATVQMVMIAFAAWLEMNIDEPDYTAESYNFFNVSSGERIIPFISMAAQLAVLWYNLPILDNFLIKSIILLLIPYSIYLIFFRMYSLKSDDAIMSLFALSPTGVIITDSKFTKTYFINNSLLNIFRTGYIPPDLMISDTVPGELKGRIENLFPDLNTIDSVEIVLKRPDGTEFDAQCRIIPSKYYSNNIIITWITDITDRKKYEELILQQIHLAETASRNKSELLHNLSNRIESGYATMKADPDGWPDFIFTGMNSRILEHFNFRDDMTGRSFRELFPEPDPVLISQFFDVLSTGESLKRDLTVRRVGKIFAVLIFKASEDEVACLVDDITQSKENERALVERERELSTLLGNLPGMAYRCKNNREWTMLFVSQGIHELCGYRPSEMVNGNISWNDIIYTDDREKVWKEGQDELIRGESYYLDYRIVTKDQKIKYVMEKGVGVYNESGELLFLEGIVFDITMQKEAESILRENEIREKEIEKARALGQMAGGIAHDLNNCFMGIGSYASLIEMKIKGDDIKKYTKGIQDGIQKSTELIDNLLLFARKSDRVTEVFSIHTLLDDIILKTGREIPVSIKIKSVFDAAHDKVDGDYKQLYKALSDVISNAVDAMPEGGAIGITTENDTVKNILLSDIAEGNMKKLFIVLKISDSGIGIERENLNRIFDPFYTTKPVGKGRGLGLSAVYGSIQAHKGAITVDSVPGKGTTFNIYLPVV